jgi:hypothetical protein
MSEQGPGPGTGRGTGKVRGVSGRSPLGGRTALQGREKNASKSPSSRRRLARSVAERLNKGPGTYSSPAM